MVLKWSKKWLKIVQKWSKIKGKWNLVKVRNFCHILPIFGIYLVHFWDPFSYLFPSLMSTLFMKAPWQSLHCRKTKNLNRKCTEGGLFTSGNDETLIIPCKMSQIPLWKHARKILVCQPFYKRIKLHQTLDAKLLMKHVNLPMQAGH